jgi:hypothetical protein
MCVYIYICFKKKKVLYSTASQGVNTYIHFYICVKAHIYIYICVYVCIYVYFKNMRVLDTTAS